MTHKQRVLDLLADGEPHSHHELYALNVIAHSRINDLRRDGHEIICWREGFLSYYQLVRYPTERVEATTTPEGAKGWVDQAGSAQVLAGGHGLDVAPDASPDGVRAETRREEDGSGGEPSNAPNAAPSLFQIPGSVPGAYTDGIAA